MESKLLLICLTIGCLVSCLALRVSGWPSQEDGKAKTSWDEDAEQQEDDSGSEEEGRNTTKVNSGCRCSNKDQTTREHFCQSEFAAMIVFHGPAGQLETPPKVSKENADDDTPDEDLQPGTLLAYRIKRVDTLKPTAVRTKLWRAHHAAIVTRPPNEKCGIELPTGRKFTLTASVANLKMRPKGSNEEYQARDVLIVGACHFHKLTAEMSKEEKDDMDQFNEEKPCKREDGDKDELEGDEEKKNQDGRQNGKHESDDENDV